MVVLVATAIVMIYLFVAGRRALTLILDPILR